MVQLLVPSFAVFSGTKSSQILDLSKVCDREVFHLSQVPENNKDGHFLKQMSKQENFGSVTKQPILTAKIKGPKFHCQNQSMLPKYYSNLKICN